MRCKKEITLTEQEKEVFSEHLERQGLSDNIWDLFDEWVKRSTSETDFFYLKAYAADELVGLGLFLKVKPYDLRSSYQKLRQGGFWGALAGWFSARSGNCVYLSFRNLITSNLDRPFFYRDPEAADAVMKALLVFLRNEKEADMVVIIDTSSHGGIYKGEGFAEYPCASESWLDATRYDDISEYLREHRSLKKNLSRRKKVVKSEIRQGPVSGADLEQITACVECSAENSRISTPCQKFFEDNIFESGIFSSDRYVHILERVENVVAGFHTFQVSGSRMGGVLGGFNREYSQRNFVYERVIVDSLDYAINNNIERVCYSMIDNHTKLRLVNTLEPCGLYFYSRSPLNRKFFQFTSKFSDMHKLYLLEEQGRDKRGANPSDKSNK